MSGNSFVGLLSLLSVLAGPGVSARAATYLNTPCVGLSEIAAEVLRSGIVTPLGAKGGSYRVSEVLWDPVLGQRWAMVASCEHPEQPAFAVPTKDEFTQRSNARKEDKKAPLIRAGEVVRLWRQEENLRIEMTAISEESGGIGKTIRVRLVGTNAEEQQFVGIVRGAGDVEMRR
jgi:hypothetical protein